MSFQIKAYLSFLKSFSWDDAQKKILTEILNGASDFDTLYKCEKFAEYLVDKDPAELQLGKFDLRV
jgi:hypothetical protein